MAPVPPWIIDAHSHLGLDTAAALAPLLDTGTRILNICVDSADLGGLHAQRTRYAKLHCDSPDRFAWCTSFSVANFEQRGWADEAIRQLDADFAAGACACKVWKNVGMELRDADGRFILPDDARLDPIYEHVAGRKKPMLMHIAEPLACWQPLSDESPHFNYYRDNPRWHFFTRPDAPSHADLTAARDRVVERHRSLTVVGAHFGSHEYDPAELVRRFDQHANFFVDTSARLGDCALRVREDRAGFRQFLIDYADRILWGVDCVMPRPASAYAAAGQCRFATQYNRTCQREWSFYATREQIAFGRYSVAGLELPTDTLRRLFSLNALRIYSL